MGPAGVRAGVGDDRQVPQGPEHAQHQAGAERREASEQPRQGEAAPAPLLAHRGRERQRQEEGEQQQGRGRAKAKGKQQK